jgi:hypothetical protein
MPYRKSTLKKGKKKYVLKSITSGKTYHYSSAAARAKGIKMHEAFKHGWKPTGKAKKTRRTRKKK